MDGVKKTVWDHLARVVKFFGQQEVKTPLSLVFKVVPYLTIAYIAILYAPGLSQDFKLKLIIWVSAVFVVLCLIVCTFAWFRPTHLVYGESGHRAERRMEYGTERESIDAEALAMLRPMRDKAILPKGHEGE
jgi:fatty acid desaturase